jgi:hypothetical protein
LFTETATIDVSIDDHIKTLGLFSISSYKLWCKRNGFPMSLEKTPDQLQVEHEHYHRITEPEDPRIQKNHSPQRADYIRRIAAGDFDGQPLSSGMSSIRKLFEDIADIPAAHAPLLRLLLHVEKYADLLHTKPAFNRLGNSGRNQVFSGLSQLARHHQHWIRPVEEWFPTEIGRRQVKQFCELAEYLLVKYEIPRSLHNAWFEPDDKERDIQQGWFIHVATGNNIRTAENLPFTLTKRAAHLFMTHKGNQPPLKALRDAQIHSIGLGNKQHGWGMTWNEHISGRENADFWTSIIHFFLNNPMLERGYISPIVDYIHHQKFVPGRIPQPDGSVIEAAPAHPNFSIKSRSINRLVFEVDDWHASLTGEENEQVKEWDSAGYGDFELEEENKDLHCGVRWTVQELCTSALLYVEGRVMHHCVGSYTKKCVEGETSIFSIRAQPIPKHPDLDEEPERPTHVLTIAVDTKKKKITQARGKFNLQPEGKISKAKNRKTDGPYQILLKESSRILALWRRQEGLAHGQD